MVENAGREQGLPIEDILDATSLAGRHLDLRPAEAGVCPKL
jgi:hypothetical protein